MNLLGNLSLSHKHNNEGMTALGLADFLSMEEVETIYDYNPFRQFYLEVNSWSLSDRFYYKIGIDQFTEYIDGKNTFAFTIPTQWVWKLTKRNFLIR